MSADPRHERLQELLADRALVGLTSREELELARLQVETGTPDDESYELAAAALELGLAGELEPPPATLRAGLAAVARDFVVLAARGPAPVRGRAAASAPAAPRAPARGLVLSGWLAAAAASLVALFAWNARQAEPDPARQRAALLERAETLRRPWTPTEQAPGASGDVAWSQELQQGVLRIRGLAPNDAAREQYQLWIFDGTREHPVDGGVFDVTGEEALVPIDAKLPVGAPTLFAVTLEKPGGVVVSDRQRIVLTAGV
ncbi:MAG TPA: anti-sigma factor [Planctomycetota bacterium]